ncbi:MAG: ring,2-phenylacetyl-CoA epoxidase subunit PaaD [Gammaproteobacteria bacterium]|nr:ring,2-phenylacetyl-CoA epoxidase subunit PaaD [Gammaproteobacteria bacterium]
MSTQAAGAGGNSRTGFGAHSRAVAAVASIAPVAPDSVVGDEASRIARSWAALSAVEDPEIPAVSVVDLGLIRFVRARHDGKLEIGLSPTYVGCPATAVIRRSVEEALEAARVGEFVVTSVLAPAWTSEWITGDGRRKLADYGIVPPEKTVSTMRDMLRGNRPVACPRCHSVDTESVSEFGSTPCKALHRCRACLEPFEYFKCI